MTTDPPPAERDPTPKPEAGESSQPAFPPPPDPSTKGSPFVQPVDIPPPASAPTPSPFAAPPPAKARQPLVPPVASPPTPQTPALPVPATNPVLAKLEDPQPPLPLPDETSPPLAPDIDPEPPRRDFLKKTACSFVGGGIIAAPIAASIIVFTDPLRRTSAAGGWTRITALEAVPADGRPKKFQVIADRQDAWNRFPSVPIGFIYLRRTGESEVAAFNASCPHAGCAVDYREGDNSYFCPCHRSHFAVDGAVVQPSPAARGLDELDVEIRDEAIWVRFQNFRAGISEKLPLA